MRKICAVTTTRADYGILSRLLEKINQKAILQLIVSGTHLSDKYGHTIDEISLPITKKIDIEIEKAPSHSMALAIEKFDIAFKELKPDIVLLLGDRYEIMAVAQAVMLNNLPIAHVSGGDITQGAIDDAIRHSITKMSHIHFTSCEEYKNRVIQLGENPSRVFNVGSLGVENTKEVPLMSKEKLEKSLNFEFGKKNLLVTFHPVTLEGKSKEQFSELLKALDELKNTKIIITCPNSDEGSNEILELINEFRNSHNNTAVFKSLGLVRYLSCMKYVDMVVGNSSSGIYETPSFKIPTINIGSRQQGRAQSSSIINCKPVKQDILNAIKLGYEKDFSDTVNIYEQDNTSDKILEILTTFDLNRIIKKEFYDLL